MAPQHIFALTVAASVANGIFSPYVAIVIFFAPIWYPNWLPDDPMFLYPLSSMALSALTLLAAGVPATLIDRSIPALRRMNENSELWLWCSITIVLSSGGLFRMLAVLASVGM